MPHARSVLVSLSCLAALTAGSAAATAQADVPLGASAKGTDVVADSGYAVWRGDDGRLVARAGGGAAKTTNLKPPASAVFDVGARRGGGFGGAQVAWAESCSTRAGTCAVRAADLRATGTLTARVIAHVPYRGGGSPALAINGSKLAYAVRSGKCDVPYVRTLPSGTARKLDRGHCGKIAQLDLTSAWVGVLAQPPVTIGSGATEARIIRTSGGPSRTLQRESQGEESNFIGSISFDGSYLYTARAGIRQANAFTRWNLSSRTRSDARAFVSLAGGFAIDRGRTSYVQTENYEGAGDCPCVVVGGDDPWGASPRTLIPSLSLSLTPVPVYLDSSPAAAVSVTRQAVTRTATSGAPVPVAGMPVELLLASVTTFGGTIPAPQPTGATATTGADGVATIPIAGPAVPYRYLAAVTRPPGGGASIPTSGLSSLTPYARMTATATRLADGRLQVSGTISPAQTGRKVRLDRKTQRICNDNVISRGTAPSPDQTGVPAGCFDAYTQDPLATADVSADGASYTLVAPASAAAGTYAVSLDSPRGQAVFPGQTTGFDVG